MKTALAVLLLDSAATMIAAYSIPAIEEAEKWWVEAITRKGLRRT